MRPLWTGAISFGLINIPVHLYSATEDHALSFELLHKKDNSPIRYARICKAEEKEVPYKDIVKGYRYEKDEYVIMEDKDFKEIDKFKTGTIEILQFVQAGEIDTVFFEKPYFLEPGKGADKSYALLRDALYESEKVGLAKFVIKNKEHLGIIKPKENALILNQMRFANEFREMKGLKLPQVKVSKKEMDMAIKLIDQLKGKFKPEEYKDDYTEELEEIIQAKIKGKPVHKRKGAAKPSKVVDIMTLLKESLKEKPVKKRKIA